MQLGGIKPIRPEDWKMPTRDGVGSTAPEPQKDEAAAQLQQIKWLMVALLIIILIKK